MQQRQRIRRRVERLEDRMLLSHLSSANANRDEAGVVIDCLHDPLVTSESGAVERCSVLLARKPADSVAVQLVSGDQLSVLPSTLTFTPENWFTSQAIVVAAVDDTAKEGDHLGRFSYVSSSADPNYDGLGCISQPCPSSASLIVQIADNDPGFMFEQGSLTVFGTAGPDTIRLLRSSRRWLVRTNFGTHVISRPDMLQKMVVLSGNGDDSIDLSRLRWGEGADVDGGGGDDSIIGGGGRDILLGGSGNDTLQAGGGDNLLIGGEGTDSLTGSAFGDILTGEGVRSLLTEPTLEIILDRWLAVCTQEEKRLAVQPLIDLSLADGADDVVIGGGGGDRII